MIEFLIILISISFTTLITYFLIPVGNGYHYFAPFLLLIAGYIVGLAIMWIFLFLCSLFFKPDYPEKHKKPSKFANYWLSEAVRYINFHAGIRLKIIKNAELPKERFMLICNHRSNFDPMILTGLYGKKELAFISKPTNFKKIPVGHRFLWGGFYLSIDRFDKMQSLQVMKQAADYIANNVTSVGVFPEGTRSDTLEMGPFHEGVFSIAIKSRCPIVVCSFMGTENIHKNFPKRTTKVTLQILDVLYPENYEGKIAKELSDECYQMIHDSLTDLN